MKPLLLFNGELFETNLEYKSLKNLLLDFFRGQDITSVNLTGLEHIISVTAGPLEKEGKPGLVYLRVYTIQMKKSGSKIPRAEIEEMGPALDLRLRRVKLPKDEVWKQAIRVPKELKVGLGTLHFSFCGGFHVCISLVHEFLLNIFLNLISVVYVHSRRRSRI